MTEDAPTDKAGAPPCGLYIRINAEPDMDLWIKALREVALTITHRSGYSRNMHVIECELPPQAGQEPIEKAAALIHLAQINGLVGIIRGTAAQAKELGADGVLLHDPALMEEARATLGADAIIGLQCGEDEALITRAAALGADYITLGTPDKATTPTLIGKAAMNAADLPCAALGPVTNDTAALYVQAGAAFIDSTAYILGHDKGTMQGAVNMLHAVKLALEAERRFN